ncbi:MAG: class I SAM-dependent methyltransferase [Saprospiraceae bacterium]|nr:class I SAM-dependent methyltransferase [Saprospiraceae bacterium]
MEKSSKNNIKPTNKYEDQNRVHALYDNAPYPEVLGQNMKQSTPLLTHWINAAVGNNGPALYSEANILSAGCGSGAEAIILAKQFPKAQVVGVDFSESSISRAWANAKAEKITNVTFEVADLMSSEWSKKYNPFDFICCHGVADFVFDPQALIYTLSNCITPNGVICITANSPEHPASKIREGFKILANTTESFKDNSDQRKLLKTIVKLMGNNVGIEGIGDAPKAYLDIDIFPPIAHHYAIDHWCRLAKEKGLWFCGSMDAPVGLTELTDDELPILFGLGRPALSLWMAKLRGRPGMQMLFSKRKPIEPTFNVIDNLLEWCPKLSPSVGILPKLKGNPSEALPLTLRFQNLPDFIINTTAFDLEILRNCNGKYSLKEIVENLPAKGNLNHLLNCLFKAYQYGILT